MQDGKNGLLVPTRSPDDFADAMIKILRDPNLKKQMAAESLAYARACAWEKRIGEYVDIYSRLS